MELCALKPQRAGAGTGMEAVLPCSVAWQILCSMLGEEDAAENDPDARFRSFSFLGSGCVNIF